MTFAEYIASERPQVKLLEWQRDWVAAVDALLAFHAWSLPRAAGRTHMLLLLRDYIKFARG